MVFYVVFYKLQYILFNSNISYQTGTFYDMLARSRVMLHFRVMEQLRPGRAAPIPVSGSLFDHE